MCSLSTRDACVPWVYLLSLPTSLENISVQVHARKAFAITVLCGPALSFSSHRSASRSIEAKWSATGSAVIASSGRGQKNAGHHSLFIRIFSAEIHYESHCNRTRCAGARQDFVRAKRRSNTDCRTYRAVDRRAWTYLRLVERARVSRFNRELSGVEKFCAPRHISFDDG